jgi:hypothetical protein
MDEFWILRNAYTNMTDRMSFNLNVELCDVDFDSSCESHENIDYLLKSLFFTLYVTEDNI